MYWGLFGFKPQSSLWGVYSMTLLVHTGHSNSLNLAQAEYWLEPDGNSWWFCSTSGLPHWASSLSSTTCSAAGHMVTFLIPASLYPLYVDWHQMNLSKNMPIPESHVCTMTKLVFVQVCLSPVEFSSQLSWPVLLGEGFLVQHWKRCLHYPSKNSPCTS